MTPTPDDIAELLAALPATSLRYDDARLLRVATWLKAERDRLQRPALVFRPLPEHHWQIGDRVIPAGRCRVGLALAHAVADTLGGLWLAGNLTALRNSVRHYTARWATTNAPELLPVLRSVSISGEGLATFQPGADCPALILA